MKLPKIVVIDGINYTIEGVTNNYKHIILKRLKTVINMSTEIYLESKMVEEDNIILQDIEDFYFEWKRNRTPVDMVITKGLLGTIAVRKLKFSVTDVARSLNCSKSAISKGTKKDDIISENVLKKIRVWKYNKLNK